MIFITIFNKALRFCKRILRTVKDTITKIMIYVRWAVFSLYPNWKGVEESPNGEDIIVSLTSYPPRINTVNRTIKSLLLQRKKPCRVILWLADSQFPQKEKDLPASLIKLKQRGLEIRWCDDLGSYKKLIPCLSSYPDSIIVTTDDDAYYRNSCLEMMYETYKANPQTICAHSVHKVCIKEGKYDQIRGKEGVWAGSTFLNRLVGVNGVLYPPHCLHPDVARTELFLKLCPTNDDIWFWLMAVRNDVKTVATPKRPRILYVGNTQKGPTLTSINEHGPKLLWRDFYNILSYYPELDPKLRSEYEKIST